MKNKTTPSIIVLSAMSIAAVFISLCVPFFAKFLSGAGLVALAPEALILTPWKCVGGCGAGGSGGGSTDGIKWVGQGVSGGLVDVEALPKYNFGQNFQYFTFAPRFSFKPTWTTTIGIRPSIVSKSGEVQPRSQMEPFDRTTGGLGDLSLDLQKAVGMNGEYSLMLGLALPTGQYDIKRGSDKASQFLPTSLQKGSGLYSASVGMTYVRDVDKGLWIADITYAYPFAMRLFSKKNEFIGPGGYFEAYADRAGDRRFYYRIKPYGENDLGDYTPPSVTGSVCYAYRGIEHYVHSFGFAFAVPLGVAWIHSEKTEIYDPRPDPDHKTWSAAFVYGLEFSSGNYPVFLALSLPLHAVKHAANPDDEYDPLPMKRWSGPDWKDFLNQWTLALGVKTSLF